VVLKDLTAGTQIDIDLTNPGGQLSVIANKLVINPSTDLAVGHRYALQMDAGAVTDVAGNAHAGIADDTTLNFVAGPPSVLALGVASGIDWNLIGGFTTAQGKRYYYLDVSNNGTAWDSFVDTVDHNGLDDFFNGGLDTVDTQPGGAVAGVDDERTALLGGYTLVLPTEAELATLLAQLPYSNEWANGTAYWSATRTAADTHLAFHPIGVPFEAMDVFQYVVAVQVVI
jgi:hypothetical protein